MTNRATTASALSFLLFAAACTSTGSGPDVEGDPTATDAPGVTSVDTTDAAGESRVASIHGTVASVAEGREGLENVNVCVVSPVFGCTVTDDGGSFELAYMPKGVSLQLTFFADGLVPAMQTATTEFHVSTLMVEGDALPAEMGATVTDRGGLLIEMVPFTYDVREETVPVALDVAGGSVEYLAPSGQPDGALTAIAPYGVAVATTAEAGTLHLEAAELGHAGCIFLQDGSYEPTLDVEITGNATTTIRMGCGGE